VKALAAERLPARFLDTMASACSSVSVVTTVAAGVPHGTTVSAFCSLSVNPPMILVSLDNTSRLLCHVRDSGRFGLNLLASDQSDLARRFATKAGDKFGRPRAPCWTPGWARESRREGDSVGQVPAIRRYRARHLEQPAAQPA
jgi:flavin reductase (DIM6/NTAB) family NADH-FMN oxidoreductase RutF